MTLLTMRSYDVKKGCAMAQPVSCRPLIAEVTGSILEKSMGDLCETT